MDNRFENEDRESNHRDPTPEREPRKPDHSIRMDGLEVAGWFTERERRVDGNFTINKRIEIEEDVWRSTNVLNRRDMQNLAFISNDMLNEWARRQRDLNMRRDHERDQTKDTRTADLWHDENQSRKDIQRERFKDERKPEPPREPRRSKPRDRSAR